MSAGNGDLSGRVALVTGAGSGIGRASPACWRATARSSCSPTSMPGACATAAGELDATALEHDVTSWVSSRRAVEDTIERHGRVDVLVNNAGVSKSVPFHELDEAEWDRVHNVNVKGVFLTTRAVVPHMMQRRSGSIISISSMVGKEAIPLFVHYSASKFAVIGMTQGLAKEMAPYDVRVNAVCPGVVRTPLWEPLLHQLADNKGITRDEAWQEFVDPHPARDVRRSQRTSGRRWPSWPRIAPAT